ncbi:MAG: NAD-dependent deacetylase [Acidobacteriota bacterium]
MAVLTTGRGRRVPAVTARLRELIARGRGVVALTGAGISAESGVPTFRGRDGFWEKERVEDLATPEGFARDPRKVWAWYEERRRRISTCAPNAGHLALARYAERRPDFTLVTQNIDGLHRAAGSPRVLALHGDIFRVRCVRDGTSRDERRVPLPEIPPHCPCGALLRPDVVWFGELLPRREIEEATQASHRAELFLVIGTSALVYPAASLPTIARLEGAYMVEINVEPTPLSSQADEVLLGPAATILPDLLGEGAASVTGRGGRS